MDIQKSKIVIAIDGHSSCGKSTFAKEIAREYGYIYIDTGAMYRAVTLACLKNGLFEKKDLNLERIPELLKTITLEFKVNEETSKVEIHLNNENVEEQIRKSEVADHVSYVSKVLAVREKLVLLQQEMGKNKGIVMDGRDIGTVVFPQAELKIFMTASANIRAERRYKEALQKGEYVTFESIKENILQRDYLDENRENSPLKRAKDAILLDNSYMKPQEQMLWFKEIIENL